MSAALEWIDLFFDILFRAVGLAATAFFYYMVWQMWSHYSRPMAYKGGPKIGIKCMVRRLWCHHTSVARVKDPHTGRNYTACTYCATDVNEGKPQEEWR